MELDLKEQLDRTRMELASDSFREQREKFQTQHDRSKSRGMNLCYNLREEALPRRQLQLRRSSSMKYDGDLHSHLIQFNAIADAHGWDDKQRD